MYTDYQAEAYVLQHSHGMKTCINAQGDEAAANGEGKVEGFGAEADAHLWLRAPTEAASLTPPTSKQAT